MSRSQPKPKPRSPSLARRRQSARRGRIKATDEDSKTMVFVILTDHEIKRLQRLARRHRTSLEGEIQRAVTTHLQSAGQPRVQLLNDFLDRLNTSLNWHNQLLEKTIRQAMKIHARRPRQLRSAAGKHRAAR